MRFLLSVLLIIKISSISCQPLNWQEMDKEKTGIFGISLDKAYLELSKKKETHPVVVAILDNGIDSNHKDLKGILWNNDKEIIDNEIDDEKNGYVDDKHGWNFLVSCQKKDIFENEEITRIVRSNKAFYDSLSLTGVPEKYQKGYRQYTIAFHTYQKQIESIKVTLSLLLEKKEIINSIIHDINKKDYTNEDFLSHLPKNEAEKNMIELISTFVPAIYPDIKTYQIEDVDKIIRYVKNQIQYAYNLKYYPEQQCERNIGNNNISISSDSLFQNEHGTHIAGIISRICNRSGKNVKIMFLKVNPMVGSPKDIDIARAITYAVDNGARIINISFSKEFYQDKPAVDKAVDYALQHNVLIVHAAGNNGINLDEINTEYYIPNREFINTTWHDSSWIEVGATGWADNLDLLASFSNYGKKKVDIMAPGIRIYSTIPFSRYGFESGTSMAAPIVTAIAALILKYYPEVSASDIKKILIRSATKVNHNIKVHTLSGEIKTIPFANTCVSKGIINSYNAVIEAENLIINKK